MSDTRTVNHAPVVLHGHAAFRHPGVALAHDRRQRPARAVLAGNGLLDKEQLNGVADRRVDPAEGLAAQ